MIFIIFIIDFSIKYIFKEWFKMKEQKRLILFVVLLTWLSLFLYGQESGKSIIITGLGSRYIVFYDVVILSTNGIDDNGPGTHGYAENTSLENGIFKGVLMLKWPDPWTGSGSYFVTTTLIDNEEYCMKKYISKEKINFNNVITELKFPQDFNFLERLEMQ